MALANVLCHRAVPCSHTGDIPDFEPGFHGLSPHRLGETQSCFVLAQSPWLYLFASCPPAGEQRRALTSGLSIHVPVSVLPSDTSVTRGFAMGCNRRDFKPDSLESWSVANPFQPLRVWGAHY